MRIADIIKMDEAWDKFLYEDNALREDSSFVLNGTKLKMHLKPNINPTKQGVRIQFKVDGQEIDPNVLETLTTGLQKVLNKALATYGMSVNEDPDVPKNEGQIIGFYLTVEQLESFIKKCLKEVLKSVSSKVKPNEKSDEDQDKEA
jgi:hypothetical protein